MLHSIPECSSNKTTKIGSKSRSLPDSAWPLCCTHSEEDHLTPLRVEKERSSKKHRCRHDGDERDWSTRRSLLTVSQTPFTVSFYRLHPIYTYRFETLQTAKKPIIYKQLLSSAWRSNTTCPVQVNIAIRFVMIFLSCEIYIPRFVLGSWLMVSTWVHLRCFNTDTFSSWLIFWKMITEKKRINKHLTRQCSKLL